MAAATTSQPETRAETRRRLAASCGVSATAHVVVLLLVSLIRMAWQEPPDRVIETAMLDATPIERPAESPPEITSRFQPDQSQTAILTGGRSLAAAEPVVIPAVPTAPSKAELLHAAVGDLPVSVNLAARVSLSLAVGSTDDGNGSGDGVGGGAGNGEGGSFFGLRPPGRRLVYVLDCSWSMNHPHESIARTRFKRIKLELLKSLAQLGPENEFFLIFFNTQPIPMPANGLVAATPIATRQHLNWMQNLSALGDTEPSEAMRMALRLRPDVVYFLTDGAFTHRVRQELFELESGSTVIHTLAFEDPFTPDMVESYLQVDQEDRRAARDAVASRKEYLRVLETWNCHQFMKTLASRHGGRFTLIPHVEQVDLSAVK